MLVVSSMFRRVVCGYGQARVRAMATAPTMPLHLLFEDKIGTCVDYDVSRLESLKEKYDDFYNNINMLLNPTIPLLQKMKGILPFRHKYLYGRGRRRPDLVGREDEYEKFIESLLGDIRTIMRQSESPLKETVLCKLLEKDVEKIIEKIVDLRRIEMKEAMDDIERLERDLSDPDYYREIFTEKLERISHIIGMIGNAAPRREEDFHAARTRLHEQMEAFRENDKQDPLQITSRSCEVLASCLLRFRDAAKKLKEDRQSQEKYFQKRDMVRRALKTLELYEKRQSDVDSEYNLPL